MNYRLLNEGEIIKEGDEYYSLLGSIWNPVQSGIGTELRRYEVIRRADKRYSVSLIYRNKKTGDPALGVSIVEAQAPTEALAIAQQGLNLENFELGKQGIVVDLSDGSVIRISSSEFTTGLVLQNDKRTGGPTKL